MIAISLVMPFLYCVLVGMAYGVLFNKRFIDSLAPAFFMQVILMLFSGILFGKLSIGIIAALLVSIVLIAYYVYKNKSFSVLTDRIDIGFWHFVFIYVFIFVANIGKHFFMWDEFSHWGWFVKESYELDAFYYTSPKYFVHKDYLPGVSLFEVLWCKLAFGYSEPNAYRGMQMLQASMMMPMAVGFINTQRTDRTRKHNIFRVIIYTVLIFTVPLFSPLLFYHTLYQDLILGVFVFYAIWLTISESFSIHSAFTFALALANLMLCKQTAIAFLPILLIFYVVFHMLYSNRDIRRWKIVISTIIAAIVAILPWRLYNAYIVYSSGKITDAQSYGSLNLQSVLGLVLHNGEISYQAEFDKEYLSALIGYGIAGKLSYLGIIAICIALCIVLMLASKDDAGTVKRVGLSTAWIGLGAIYYAVLMYFMYLLMFSEYEARGLASFSRYMSTYLITAMLVVVALFLHYSHGKLHYLAYFVIILVIENIALFFGAFQLLPGQVTGEGADNEVYANYLNTYVPEGASLLMTTALENIGTDLKIGFYCDDISIDEAVFGHQKSDDDIWSRDITIAEFVDICSEYDYIYFFSYDDDFVELYADAFENPDDIQTGGLYQIEIVDGIVRTDSVE